MSQLEDLLFQWYDWQGYVVKRNVKVGKLGHGGWEGELDIVAYHPKNHELLHVEPSIDADSWTKREERFAKKFASGSKYIHADVFGWLDGNTPLRQIAVLTSRGRGRETLAGAEIITVDEVVKQIRDDVAEWGIVSKRAIPEQFDLLRTVQLVVSGYHRLAN